ncbi:MAG: ABC transporter permease [bacterium]|nr:ABC transporter permease [bacterium]
MNFLSLIRVEFCKIRRSKILLILTAAAFILWLPAVLNADLNFEMQAEGISPENNFLIQGFMGMAWFLFPAGVAVSTVMLNMTERSSGGILKMLSLPVAAAKLCLAKFAVLLALAAFQILLHTGMYFISAGIASRMQGYSFMLPPLFVFREAGLIFAAAIPMTAVFWLLSVWIQTPVFSVGIGLASIVPSVLIINTKIWFAYPMAYPFFVITAEYGKLAENLTTAQIEPIPWIPVACGITVFCLTASCLCFGQAERR